MKDIATSSTTAYILDKYNLQALKKFGQNFLIDKNVVEKIVATGNIDKNTCVIEIGPGIGALTQVLARYAGKVRCYEIDERLIPVHQEFLSQDNIEIIYQDFLEVDVEAMTKALNAEYQNICIIANLPYYITTKLIEKVVLSNSAINQMVVMVQKEVAQKFSKDYASPLTRIIQSRGSCDYAFTVSKNVFNPQPNVDSAILKIKLEQPYDQKLYEVLEVCFNQRRKTIYNNLKQKYEHATQILEKSDIPLNLRSEQITIEQFKNITKNI